MRYSACVRTPLEGLLQFEAELSDNTTTSDTVESDTHVCSAKTQLPVH